MLALSQLLSLLPDRIGLYELIPSADPIFYSRAIPSFSTGYEGKDKFSPNCHCISQPVFNNLYPISTPAVPF
jgi:hypothetical protein